MAKRKRVLSGMRPTGRLHIGHYFGALSNWIRMQDEHDCFFFVADWHALTTHYADTSQVAQNTIDIGTDWLAAGLSPEKATIFVQSLVPEHAELHLLLSMITPLGWLERVPTYKEQIDTLKEKDLGTYGFLGYPLLQGADIVLYDADFVPVGEDQVPHIELTREIVRRFNLFYGLQLLPEAFSERNRPGLYGCWDKFAPSRTTHIVTASDNPLLAEERAQLRSELLEAISDEGFKNLTKRVPELKNYAGYRAILHEPGHELTETPRLPGTDGRRMAKSYGNFILLGEDPESVREKVRNMMTDPQRVRRTDPGRPEVCPVFAYHKLFSPAETVAEVDRDCRTAAIGCVDCKARMADGLVKWIEPIRERRKEYEAAPEKVWEILQAGSAKARKAAKKTMRRVREAIFAWEQLRASW